MIYGHKNNILLGISASAVVWSVVEFFDKIIDICTIYEKEKNEFYSHIIDNNSQLEKLVKRNPKELNYTEINEALASTYNEIIQCQNKSDIFGLSEEFLAVSNYFACLKEMVEDFNNKQEEDVYNLLIIKKERSVGFESVKSVLTKPKPYNFIKPVFSKDKVYEFHNIEEGNEGDILHNVSLSFPDSKFSETMLTFKPMHDLYQFMLDNKMSNIVEVIKIFLFNKWFKEI